MLFFRKPVEPAMATTVDEAIVGLNNAVEQLAAIESAKLEEADDLMSQSSILGGKSNEATREAVRAGRIRQNIQDLLK